MAKRGWRGVAEEVGRRPAVELLRTSARRDEQEEAEAARSSEKGSAAADSTKERLLLRL